MKILSLVILWCLNACTASTNISESGLPLLKNVVRNVSDIALDILSRSQVRNMSWVQGTCYGDKEFYEWCGGTVRNPYLYCVYTDHWPRSDLLDWLSTTYVTPYANNSAYYKFPFYPSYCACPNNGRAWLTTYQIGHHPLWNTDCPAEVGLLAIQICMGLCYTILSVLLIADIVLWILFFLNAEREFGVWGSFIPKVLILLCALSTTVGIIMEIIGPSFPVNPSRYFGQIWAWAMGIILFLMSYLSWTTMYFDVIMAITTLQATERNLLILLRWVIIILVMVPLLSVMICLGIAYGYGEQINIVYHTMPEISQAGANVYITEKVLSATALGAWFTCFVWGTGLVIATLRMINKGSSGDSEEERNIFFSKTIYTLGATLSGWVAWGAQAVYCIVGTFKVGSFWGDYTMTPYQLRFCELWLLWCSHLFIFGVLVFLSLALKTHFSNGQSYWKALSSSFRRATSSGSGNTGVTVASKTLASTPRSTNRKNTMESFNTGT